DQLKPQFRSATRRDLRADQCPLVDCNAGGKCDEGLLAGQCRRLRSERKGFARSRKSLEHFHCSALSLERPIFHHEFPSARHTLLSAPSSVTCGDRNSLLFGSPGGTFRK